MSLEQTSTARSGPEQSVILHGRRLVIARVVVTVVSVVVVLLFIRSIPLQFTDFQTVCRGHRCVSGQLDPADVRSLQALGLSRTAYAAYSVALSAVFLVVYGVVAAVLVWRRSNERMALFSALALVTFGGATFTGAMDVLARAYPAWWWLVAGLDFLGGAALVLFFYLFPDGRFVARWSRWLALLWVLSQGTTYFFPDSPFNVEQWPFALGWLVYLVGIGSAVATQIYRYLHVASPLQRQQTKVVVFGITVTGAGFLTLSLGVRILSEPLAHNALASLIVGTVLYGVMMLVPLSIGLAILRYRLWDVDAVINRTLVYATLTATLGLVYIGSIILLIELLRGFSSRQSSVAIAAATLIIAALFQPLRRRIQRDIDRRFYRRKYDAAQAVAAFSARLRDEVELTTVTADLLAVVEETLQPAHASLWLRAPDKTT